METASLDALLIGPASMDQVVLRRRLDTAS